MRMAQMDFQTSLRNLAIEMRQLELSEIKAQSLDPLQWQLDLANSQLVQRTRPAGIVGAPKPATLRPVPAPK